MEEERSSGKRAAAFFLIAILLAAAIACFAKYSADYRKDRLVDALAESAYISSMRAGSQIASFFEESRSTLECFANEISAVDPEGEDAPRLAAEILERVMRAHPEARFAWVRFEPDDRSADDARRDGFGENGGFYFLVEQGGHRILYRGQIPDYAYNLRDVSPETQTVTLTAPLVKGSRAVGVAGFGLSFDALLSFVTRLPEPADAKTVLLDGAGDVVVDGQKRFPAGVHYRELDRYWPGFADAAGRTLEALGPDGGRLSRTSIHIIGLSPDTLIHGARVRVDADVYWSLLHFVPTASLYRDIERTHFAAAFTLYVILTILGVAVWKRMMRRGRERSARPAPKAAGEPSTAAAAPVYLTAEAKERLKQLRRKRFLCRLLAVLFFVPSLFFMKNAEARFAEAEKAGNLSEAERAAADMLAPALAGLFIGAILLAIRIMAD